MAPTQFASEAAVGQGQGPGPQQWSQEPNSGRRPGGIADAPAVCQSPPAPASAAITTTATISNATPPITTSTGAGVARAASGHAHAAPDAPDANIAPATGPSPAHIADVPPKKGRRRSSQHADPPRTVQDPPAQKMTGQQEQAQQEERRGGEAGRRGLPEPTPASSSSPLSSSPGQAQTDAGAEAYEREHVHGVYEAIAPHFSATRHKPWPLVAEFLRAQPPGAVGLDVGCGNGKYLGVVNGGSCGGREGVFLVGSDRSTALVGLARGVAPAAGKEHGPGQQGNEVLVADGLALPFRKGVADFVISVAVIHHLSTRERRRDGIRQLLECLRPEADGGGKVLVYVWALEQSSSRRGWDDGGDQDLLVPWVMKNQRRRKAGPAGEGTAATDSGQQQQQPPEQTFQRYYHLYRKGELEEDVRASGGKVHASGYERDNWWVVAANGIS